MGTIAKVLALASLLALAGCFRVATGTEATASALPMGAVTAESAVL